MLHLAIVLMLQQAAAPVPPAAAQPAPAPPAALQAATPAPGNELLQVKNVYILPMGSSFDQFLANRLTRGGVLQVVTDPAKADAVLTDRIGKGLEAKLEELYPDPAKKAAAEAQAAKEKEKEEDRDSERSMQIHSTPLERGGSGGRAKGTLFLVHRGSRNVIWSVYEAPRTTRPNDLDDAAAVVVSNLASAIGKEAKAAGVATVPGARKSGWKPW